MVLELHLGVCELRRVDRLRFNVFHHHLLFCALLHNAPRASVSIIFAANLTLEFKLVGYNLANCGGLLQRVQRLLLQSAFNRWFSVVETLHVWQLL